MKFITIILFIVSITASAQNQNEIKQFAPPLSSFYYDSTINTNGELKVSVEERDNIFESLHRQFLKQNPESTSESIKLSKELNKLYLLRVTYLGSKKVRDHDSYYSKLSELNRLFSELLRQKTKITIEPSWILSCVYYINQMGDLKKSLEEGNDPKLFKDFFSVLSVNNKFFDYNHSILGLTDEESIRREVRILSSIGSPESETLIDRELSLIPLGDWEADYKVMRLLVLLNSQKNKNNLFTPFSNAGFQNIKTQSGYSSLEMLLKKLAAISSDEKKIELFDRLMTDLIDAFLETHDLNSTKIAGQYDLHSKLSQSIQYNPDFIRDLVDFNQFLKAELNFTDEFLNKTFTIFNSVIFHSGRIAAVADLKIEKIKNDATEACKNYLF